MSKSTLYVVETVTRKGHFREITFEEAQKRLSQFKFFYVKPDDKIWPVRHRNDKPLRHSPGVRYFEKIKPT